MPSKWPVRQCTRVRVWANEMMRVLSKEAKVEQGFRRLRISRWVWDFFSIKVFA